MSTRIVLPINPKRWQMRLFGLSQIFFLGWAIYWTPYRGRIPFAHLPLPGYAVAVIAVVAAIMSIQGEMRPWQKAAWMLIIGLFLVVELRAIKSDRDDSDAKALQAKKDADIAFGKLLKAQDDDFKLTAKALQETINGLTKNLNTAKAIFSQTRPRASINSLNPKMTFLEPTTSGVANITIYF